MSTIVNILVAIAPDIDTKLGLLLGKPSAFLYMGFMLFIGFPVALFMLSYPFLLMIAHVREIVETNGKWEAIGFVSGLVGFFSLMVAVCSFSWIALVVGIPFWVGAFCVPKNPNSKNIGGF